MRQLSLAIVLVACATPKSPPPPAPAPVASAQPTAPTDAAIDSPAVTTPPVDAAAPAAVTPSAAIVLERLPCRSSAGFRIELGLDGAVAFTTDPRNATTVQRASVNAADVRTLGDKLVSWGLATWGDARCTPSDARRCSMHPCTTVIRATRDGATHTASFADDAPPPAGVTAAVVAIERTARAWQWLPDTFDGSPPGACSAPSNCTIVADSCKRLHPAARGEKRDFNTPDKCELAIWPASKVEPACIGGRCAIQPVDADNRACKRDKDCTAVRLGCDGVGAIRTDKVRDIAVRNDHQACAGNGPKLPAVACRHDVCVIR